MAKFQMIELILKTFKTRNNFEVSKNKGVIDPLHSLLELEKYTLGNFLKDNHAVKIITNNEIINILDCLRGYRNFVAHKAFLMLSDIDDKEYFLGYETSPIDYLVLNKELDDVIARLIAEYQQTGIASKKS